MLAGPLLDKVIDIGLMFIIISWWFLFTSHIHLRYEFQKLKKNVSFLIQFREMKGRDVNDLDMLLWLIKMSLL